ncbi:MAG: N-acetyltransferase [Dehalococcoidia bacterium]|nr:N-acetyltransferase [Dehalococcoidia bacterium]
MTTAQSIQTPGTKAVQVSPVRSSRDLDDFIRLPWRIYRGDRCWVPPLIPRQKELLDRSRHPFHRHAEVEYFLASQDGQVVGRVAAILNHRHNEFHHENVGFFGFFECVESEQVAVALLQAAGAWLRERGAVAMRGPASFSSNEEWGLLIEGFERPPTIMMSYNPRYYASLLEGAGLAKIKDLVAWHSNLETANKTQLRRLTDRLARSGDITVRPINMKRFNEEVKLLHGLYNKAWSLNWGFVPMTEEEFFHMARQLKDLVMPDIILVGYVKGEPAGFSLSLLDYNQAFIHMNGRMGLLEIIKFLWHSRKIRFTRAVALGVAPAYQRKGLDALLMLDSFNRAMRKGITEGEISWVLEDNMRMNNTCVSFGLKVYKRYRVYERALS